MFPDKWERFQAPIPPEERSDLIGAYHRRLTHPDLKVQLAAARTWSHWEASTLALAPDPDRIRQFSADAYALAFARIECHYFVNRGFFDHDGQLLRDAYRLRTTPGIIVHGRYDVVTPVKSAFDLKAEWPHAELIVVPDAGHAMTEPGIVHEIVLATRRLSEA